MQNAAIVEDDSFPRGQRRREDLCSIPEDHREGPVRTVKLPNLRSWYLQWRYRPVVVVDRFNRATTPLNDWPLGRQIRVRIRELKAHRRRCQHLECARILRLQHVCCTEAVGKQAGPTFSAVYYAMEYLQSGYWLAVWVVCMQSQGEAGIGQIIRIRNCADIKHSAVICIAHPAHKSCDLQHLEFISRHTR